MRRRVPTLLVSVLVALLASSAVAFPLPLCRPGAATPLMSAVGNRRLTPQDSTACQRLLARVCCKSGAAAQLLWRVSSNDGRVLDQEEW